MLLLFFLVRDVAGFHGRNFLCIEVVAGRQYFLPHHFSDFTDQYIGKLRFGYLSNELSFPEQDTLAPASSDTDIRFAGLAGTVYHASHDSHFGRRSDIFKGLFNTFHQAEQINFTPPARGTGDDLRPPRPEIKGPEDLVGNLDFLYRIAGEGNAKGVSNAPPKEGTNGNGILDGS